MVTFRLLHKICSSQCSESHPSKAKNRLLRWTVGPVRVRVIKRRRCLAKSAKPRKEVAVAGEKVRRLAATTDEGRRRRREKEGGGVEREREAYER
ncbi:hypothetical protein HAX54_006989 [Datura stramonium]|uniref:Uncharacterized protein n=1 Tax=Datura stramonium TaxID=4076 RepID=A0ABS8TCI2_DATST|nr:hypothetical protein [Datura stramonium]